MSKWQRFTLTATLIKKIAEKFTHNLMNGITIICQKIIKIFKFHNENIKIITKSFQTKKILKKTKIWILNVCESKKLKIKFYVVCVMNIMMNDATTNAKQTRNIKKQNKQIHSKIKIIKISWPKSMIKWNKFKMTFHLKIENAKMIKQLIYNSFVNEYE